MYVVLESTPNGESIVAISSSDPNVEKYFKQQFATRSGFTQLIDDEKKHPLDNQPTRPQGAVHSSFSVAVPGKAIAGAGRSFASASSGPFLPIFSFPIASQDFGFNNFDLNDWVRNVESFYNPNFAGNSHVNTVTAVNDNGHVYGNVNSVTFDNRAKNVETYNSRAENSETFNNSAKVLRNIDNGENNGKSFENKDKNNAYFHKRAKSIASFDNV